MNFVKNIFDKEIDEKTHQQFTRFGKGEYKGRFPLNLRKSKKIKFKSGYEFSNDLVKLCALFGNCKISGIVTSKEDISDIMGVNNIKGNSETKKGGLFYVNNIDEQEITPEKLLELEKAAYFTLLDIEGDGFKIKMKKKLPKPGKNEKKIDDKFCQLEADEKYYSKIKEYFFWDMPEAKKISIKHSIIIEQLIMPKGEKDYAKMRELAKRKGKLIRNVEIDDKTLVKEIEFEA